MDSDDEPSVAPAAAIEIVDSGDEGDEGQASARATPRRAASLSQAPDRGAYAALVADRKGKLRTWSGGRPRGYDVQPAAIFAHGCSVQALCFPRGSSDAFTGGSDGFVRSVCAIPPSR